MTPPVTSKAASNLQTKAWLLLGFSSLPGELSLRAGILSFVASNTGSAWPWQLRKLEKIVGSQGIAASVEQGKKTLLFQWPAKDLQHWFPWHYFGGGMKIKRQGQVLRFSFGTPANMRLRGHGRDPESVIQDVSAGITDVQNMRAVGTMWRSALDRSVGARSHT
jgi:hypothetical protein